MALILIFPRKIMQRVFELKLPHGARAGVREKGWMTKLLFYACAKSS